MCLRLFSVVIVVCMFGGAGLAEKVTAPQDQPFVCSGDAGNEKCICMTQPSCKAMIDACKNGAMQCTGPVCNCDMARRKPMLGIGGVPKAGTTMDGSIGN
jgi:hypothetical protein